MSTSTFWRLFACFALAAIFTGCGSGVEVPDLVPVTGTVTMDGSPVEGASVTFTPEVGRPSGALTNAEGVYELYYSEDHLGAVPGKHTVRISKMDGEAGNELIPAAYNVESTLTKEVTKDGPNEFPLEVKSK